MFEYEKAGNMLIVRLKADLDHSASILLRTGLDKLLADRQIRCLVLDLKELKFMDSSGIGFIIGRYKLMAKRGGIIKIKNADRRMDRIFEMAGLYRLVERMAQGG